METLAPCSFSASIILPSSFQHASIPFQHPVRSPPYTPQAWKGLEGWKAFLRQFRLQGEIKK